ncbi:MAG: deoxyribodipyrimidine photo-lyase [Pseudomonadota bacterium]
MHSPPVIVCFRNDLRLNDNSALNAAVESGAPIVLCYVYDDSGTHFRPLGAASRWWLHHSLNLLAKDLERRKVQLLIRHGDWVDELEKLAVSINAQSVYWNQLFDPHAHKVEEALHLRLQAHGISAHRYKGYLLHEPSKIRTGSDLPYKVFTPFWRRLSQAITIPSAQPLAKIGNVYSSEIDSLVLDELQLLPGKPDWAGGMREAWEPGERGAQQQLDQFIEEAISDYASARDIPSIAGTSRLSPYLRFGEISPRQVWRTVVNELSGQSGLQQGADAYLRELGWREFCYHLFQLQPDMHEKPFRPNLDAFPWRSDEEVERAWQQGKTGIPLVDAGMRQLWHCGWMHNRVRMVVASLLSKNLRIDWRVGEQWFWDTLVDADPASNTAGWQWVAGCGADAAPYFRIFNPVSQSKKFDPNGDYLRRWLPELAQLDSKQIHEPPTDLSGLAYPAPIVDFKASRQFALDAYNVNK